MKRVLISLSIIGAVAAIAIGATTAFFSDTETSTGNTFTAGSLDLTVDSTCHYWQDADANGQYEEVKCPTTSSWALKDLDPVADKFFQFSDIKPGDRGENTISLHVDNDAWLRLNVENVSDLDNSCTEPEVGSSGELCTVAAPEGTTAGVGELRENLLFSVFVDGNCNNILDGSDYPIISEGTVEEGGEIWTLPTYIPGNQTTCFGIAWNLPTTVGNIVQSDSMGADLRIQVEQYRNNPTPSWQLP